MAFELWTWIVTILFLDKNPILHFQLPIHQHYLVLLSLAGHVQQLLQPIHLPSLQCEYKCRNTVAVTEFWYKTNIIRIFKPSFHAILLQKKLPRILLKFSVNRLCITYIMKNLKVSFCFVQIFLTKTVYSCFMQILMNKVCIYWIISMVRDTISWQQ